MAIFDRGSKIRDFCINEKGVGRDRPSTVDLFVEKGIDERPILADSTTLFVVG